MDLYPEKKDVWGTLPLVSLGPLIRGPELRKDEIDWIHKGPPVFVTGLDHPFPFLLVHVK